MVAWSLGVSHILVVPSTTWRRPHSERPINLPRKRGETETERERERMRNPNSDRLQLNKELNKYYIGLEKG